MAGMTLYEATAALQITDEWLEEFGGELTPELEAAIEQAEGDFATKAERVALKAKALEAEAKAIKEEEERLAARRKARENGAKSLKTYLGRMLEVAGKDKVNGTLVTIAFQNNPPSVQVPEAIGTADLAELFEAGAPGIEHIPATFAVNKRAVLEAWKEKGDAVLPTGWAVVQARSLRIR